MKSFPLACVIASIMALLSQQCLAASSAVLTVSASIRPWVSFNAIQNVHSYRVTDADLQRGYVELTGSITVELKTNIDRDIPVRITSEGGEKILLRVDSGGDFIENECRLNPARQVPMQSIRRKIDSRIMLTSDSRVGEYYFNVYLTPEI